MTDTTNNDRIVNHWLAEQPDDKVALVKARMHASSGRNWMDYAGGDEDFAVWMFLADRSMTSLVGVGPLDIADFAWRDSYDNGDPPKAAVREALEADDTFSALFRGE